MKYKLTLLVLLVFFAASSLAIYYSQSEEQNNSRPPLEDLDDISLTELYSLYRKDIDNSRPHDYTISDPLARRGAAAAHFMLNRLAVQKDPREVRGILIVLEKMKHLKTFDACLSGDFYSKFVQTWKLVDPNDQYYNIPSIEALCPKLIPSAATPSVDKS